MLDASAMLAYIQGEEGEDLVEYTLTTGDAVCSAANWSEVAQQVQARQGRWDLARALLLSFGLTVEPVTMEDGRHAQDFPSETVCAWHWASGATRRYLPRIRPGQAAPRFASSASP